MNRRASIGVSVVVALVAAFASPVSAQDDPPPSTTAPTTQAPTTTGPTTTSTPASTPETTEPANTEEPEDSSDTGPSTTVPGDTVPGDTIPGDETTTTIDPDSPEATDPLVDEGPAESVPEGSGRYAGQPDFVETEVLWSSVREAEARLAEAEADHLLAVASVKALRLRLKDIRAQITGFDAEDRQAFEDLVAAEELLELRALTAFVRGDSFESMGAIDHDAILESMAQQTMVEAVFNQDAVAIEGIESLRDRIGVEVEIAYDRLAIVEDLEASAVTRVDDALAEIDQAQLELRAFEAGSEVFIDGLVFPVGDGVETPLIDSFGFARMTGTPDQHWHEGIDIFAPTGTPLYAAERGVITRIGTGRLGGLKLWLRGESGTDWYYAHLSAFNDQLREGDLVDAGDLVGYVGQSGNAVGTPPHVHMQMHPGGARPVNPYPLLNMRLELDREDALADQRES